MIPYFRPLVFIWEKKLVFSSLSGIINRDHFPYDRVSRYTEGNLMKNILAAALVLVSLLMAFSAFAEEAETALPEGVVKEYR